MRDESRHDESGRDESRKRRRPRPRKKTGKGMLVAIIGAAAVGLAGLIGCVVVMGMYTARQREEAEAQNRARADEGRARMLEQERAAAKAEAEQVFAAPTRPDPADAREFAAVLDDLGGALERGDAGTVTRTFDPDRLIRELEQIRAFDRLPGGAGPGFREGVRKGMDEKFGAMLAANEMLRWTHTDVRHVRWSPSRQEVMLIAVHRKGDTDDLPLRFRWWLVKRPGGWKVYDFEDMQMGMRATRMIAALATPELLERHARDPVQFQTAMAGIRTALVLLSKHDIEGADAALAPARRGEWPAPVRAVTEFIEGALLLARGDAAGALARFDEAERLFPGMPAVTLMRGSALVLLGRHVEALDAVRAYQKEIGPDALSYTLEGAALEGQEKKAEAADAFRRALDEVAEHADAFHGLRRVLPAGARAELGERLSRLKDPFKLYYELVGEARNDGDEAAADALLDGLLKARPDDPRALGEDVRRKVRKEQFADALAVVNRALKAKEPEDRESVLRAYLYAMLGAGKALDAYSAVPAAHAGTAFRTLGAALEDDISDPEDPKAAPVEKLKALIAAHRKRFPNDPLLWFYEGAIQQHAKEYEKAEKTFAVGAAKLGPVKVTNPDNPTPNWDAEQFRSRRVECLFKLKKGLDAYRDIGPVNDTFAQLANLYEEEKDLAGLEKLIAAHRDTGDPEATFWQAYLLYRKGKYGPASAAYDKYLEKTGPRAPNRWRAQDEMVRSRLRVNPKGAAEALTEFGADKFSAALRAAVAAATGDRAELVRLLEESTRGGEKTWFYSDEDFRRAFAQDKYRDLRAKYPDPNPPPKVDG